MRERMVTSTGEEEATGAGGDTTDEGTSGDFPIGDTDGCPWWGCELPGDRIWDDIVTDCSYPIGHPEMGDALCPSPKVCVTPQMFGEPVEGGNWWQYEWKELESNGLQVADCTLPCWWGPLTNTDPCDELARALPDFNPSQFAGFYCTHTVTDGVPDLSGGYCMTDLVVFDYMQQSTPVVFPSVYAAGGAFGGWQMLFFLPPL